MRTMQTCIVISLLINALYASAKEGSPAFQQFIKRLQKDQYTVTYDERDRDLDFCPVEGTCIKTPQGSCTTYYTKRNYPLKKPTGGWYPRFAITEITYRDSLTAANECKKIDRIISANDRMNEKNYDFIVQNGNTLIYVSTGARIFMEYTFSYKSVLLEIISTQQ